VVLQAAPRVGEDELVIAVLSAPDSSSASSSSDGLVGRGLMMESVAMEGKVKTMQQRKWWKDRSEKWWDETCSAVPALLAQQATWWRFVSKKSVFLFQQPAQSGRGIKEPKGGSLKDFEVCDIPEKELLHNGQKVINPIGTVICPK
jgi:hypothetical protein